jgi:hypothetical protein
MPPIPTEVQEMFASATTQYVKEIEASVARLNSDARRVAGLTNITDPNVFGNIRQFEKKVFGASFKFPDNPLELNDKKKLKILVEKNKDELSGSMGGNVSTIILFIALGLAVAGVAVSFLFKR